MKIFFNEKLKQINVLDERFYTEDEITYYPSVTTILSVYPKGYYFEEWLKQVGLNANDIRDRAGEVGSNVHNAIDWYLKGIELSWFSEHGKEQYTLEEWQMIAKFVEFWERHTPKLISSETNLISHKMKVGGTIDLVCEIDGEYWLIDHKTSNAIKTTHELQLAAYAMMWNEINPSVPITRCGVMHLKAQTRTEGNNGKIQGKGWKLHEFDRSIEEAYKLYRHTRAIWDEENPNYKPKNLQYPSTFKATSLEN